MPGAEVDIDYTQPLAVLLRQGTAKAHEAAENSAGAVSLTRGELDKGEYVRFLMMLYYVYGTLERGLDRHADHPTLAPTYNPSLLARASNIASDISYLLQTPENSWMAHPIHVELKATFPPALKAYVERLEHLLNSDDPSRLLAHAYVRYLGDLSGGQVIRRRVAKAYGLDLGEDEGSGLGTKFYDFKQLGGSKSGNMGDFKKIKDWYREGMNQGAGDDVSKKMDIVDEAQKAFEYNTNLFKILRPPTARPPTTTQSLTPEPVLGDPTSPVSPSFANLHHPESKPEQSRVVASYEEPERLVTISSVVTVCLAVGITHFALVVGGFTGQSGQAKYLAFWEWLKNLLPH